MKDISPHSNSTSGAAAAPASLQMLEAHRAALTGHCYRMLGSITEADDAVQETMLRALRSFDQFAGRAALRTWLYRIATRVCLDALYDRRRRTRPVHRGPQSAGDEPLDMLPAAEWIEPIPDVSALPADADPAELTALRQSIRLAFIAALQYLPPRQRAALLLTEVLDWPATEVAESLETSVAAVNSALQRARKALASRERADAPTPLSAGQATMLDRYVDAFERYDMDALAALLHNEATLSMPPYPLWFRGPAAICRWMLGRGAACRGSRLVPTAACGSPAFGQYKPDGPGRYLPWALIVLECADERITGMNFFLDTQTLFPRFGLPLELTE